MRYLAPLSRIPLVGVFAILAFHPGVCRAIDNFDRHDAGILTKIASAGTSQAEFTPALSSRLRPLSRDLEGTFIVLETNNGNLAKALVSWGFRKSKQAPTPVPVIMLDRFVTYQQGKADTTIANGKNVMLFPGFSFDFDLGQVVPKGFDADIECSEKGALKALEGVKLYGVDGSQLPMSADTGANRKTTGTITPQDFSGVWQVDGDGRWVGEWDLQVNEQGEVSGKFLSAETESSYPISGGVGPQPNQIKLEIRFANTTQAVEAWLWTKDKSKLAGSFSMEGRKFGFVGNRKSGTP